MDQRDVREILNEIALATAQATVAAVESGRLKREDQEYVVTETAILAPGALTSGRQKVIRKVWDAFAANRIVEEIQKGFAEAIEICAQKLTKDRKNTPTVRGDLGYFLLAVVKQAADEMAVDFISEIVDRLLFEYEGGELEWTGTIWLNGVRVSEPIEIRSVFTLRPPIAEDFNSEVPSDVFGFGMPPYFNIPDAVLESTRKSRERPELRREVNALCLFRLGSIEILQENWRSNSIFPYMGSNSTPLAMTSLRSTALSYELRKEDGPSLAAFLNEMPKDFPLKPIGHHDNPKWIALKNYFLALYTATDVPERITQAVSSLESALLADNTKQEATFRLRLRTASVLRFAGFDPVQVYKDMGKAYDVRSKYSHGAEIDRKLLETANALSPLVMDYARFVVVKFMQLPDNKNDRTELLIKLDLSLLDDAERDKLRTNLGGGLWTHIRPEGEQG